MYKKKDKLKNMFGMQGKIKVFNKDLHDKFDKKARDIIKNKLGDSVSDNPNIYGEDMLFNDKSLPCKYIELQVYGNWKEKQFPSNLPYVYERKMKFSDSTLFVCFNASYDRVIMFSRKSIHPKKYKLEKYSREFVNYVPWSKVLNIEIDELHVETIKKYYGVDEDEDEKDDVDDVDDVKEIKIE